MKILFKKVKNIYLIDMSDRTPLHTSASEGYLDTCKWLINKEILNKKLIDNFGSTPLFDGFISGHQNIVTYLYLNSFIYESNL